MDSMGMTSAMAMTSATGMDMPMSTGMDMPMSSSTMDMGNMDMSQMNMVFFTSVHTPFLSNAWTPNGSGTYAATCIFLITLSVILRSMYAFKSALERHWLHQALKRRYIVTGSNYTTGAVSGSDSDSQSDEKAVNAKARAVLTTNGLTENVRLVETPLQGRTVQPWRLSVDLPRAMLVTVMVGVGYLLMLAVMTMNVGYFLSVLAGAFLGELFVGRYSSHVEEHH